MRNWFTYDDKAVILFYGTKLNHSCNPNIKYMKEGNVMVFRTKRPIQPGEELFDSYINCQMCKADRQSKLKRCYGFDCQCDKCNHEIL
jgi:SET domain-containing protein